MSARSDLSTPKNEPVANPPDDFNENLMKKIRGQQTLKDYLFMIVVGFRRMLEGFFKLETIKHLKEPDQIDPFTQNPKE